MTKWEYAVLEMAEASTTGRGNPVAKMGKAGWELVSTYQKVGMYCFRENEMCNHFLWFKRPLINQDEVIEE